MGKKKHRESSQDINIGLIKPIITIAARSGAAQVTAKGLFAQFSATIFGAITIGWVGHAYCRSRSGAGFCTSTRAITTIMCSSAIHASGTSRDIYTTGTTATSFTGCTCNTIIICVAARISATCWMSAYVISVRA